MTGQIKIGFEEVYSKVASLRIQVDTAQRQMEEEHRQILPRLDHVDGKTCAACLETMERDKQKADRAFMVLKKLLSFVENSTRQAEALDQAIKAILSLGGLIPGFGGGRN